MKCRIRWENNITGTLNEAAQLDLESIVLIIWPLSLPYCILFALTFSTNIKDKTVETL